MLLHHGGYVRRLMQPNMACPPQKFLGNADDRALLGHPFDERIEGLGHGGVFSNRHPRGLNQQRPEIFVAAGCNAGRVVVATG